MNNPVAWAEGFFKAADGVDLFYRVYTPANPKKSLVLFHGFGEHSLRYEKFTQYFSDFQIAIFDLRGMGRSSGKSAYAESIDQYAQDALIFLNLIQTKYPVSGVPRWMLGHSLGGLNLMRLCLEHDVEADGLVFSAPCFHPAVTPALLILNSWIAAFNPSFIYNNPVYYLHLTHDAAERISYQKDPLILHKMTSRLLNEMARSGKEIENMKSIKLSAPAHFLLAGDDKLVRSDVAQKVFDKIVAPQKSLKTYENFYHEIFNEVDQSSVFADLLKIIS